MLTSNGLSKIAVKKMITRIMIMIIITFYMVTMKANTVPRGPNKVSHAPGKGGGLRSVTVCDRGGL